MYVPRAVTDANANGHTGRSEGAEGAEGFEDVDFAAEAVFVGPGASRVRGGGANVAGGRRRCFAPYGTSRTRWRWARTDDEEDGRCFGRCWRDKVDWARTIQT